MTSRMKSDVSELPVVLVHGYLSTAEMLTPLAARLRGRGFKVFSSELSPFCIQDVRKLADELSDTVDRVIEETGAAKVNLVGLSQGGIIALYYTKLVDEVGLVRHLVAAGSPFKGTWAPVAGLLATPWLGVVSRGVWQVMPNSRLLAELHGAPMPPEVEVTTIAVEGDLVSPPERCTLPGAPHIVVDGVPFVSHQWLVFSQPVAAAIARALGDDEIE